MILYPRALAFTFSNIIMEKGATETRSIMGVMIYQMNCTSLNSFFKYTMVPLIKKVHFDVKKKHELRNSKSPQPPPFKLLNQHVFYFIMSRILFI